MRLTENDRQRIQAAVHNAEARTGVHIATAIVPVSDRYALYPVVWGALIAMATSAVVTLAWPALSAREVFVFQAVIFVLVSLVADWWPVRVHLVPAHVRRAHASALAHREFAARVLAGGKGGMLLFVSLGERYAEVIADRALHARIGTEAWNRIVAHVLHAASSGRVGDGIVEAIDSCADEILAGLR